MPKEQMRIIGDGTENEACWVLDTVAVGTDGSLHCHATRPGQTSCCATFSASSPTLSQAIPKSL